MKRYVFVLAVLAMSFVPAALRGDSLIITGGGSVGLWDTEIDMANAVGDPIAVSLSIRGLPLAVPCPPNCTRKVYPLPGNGTLRIVASDFIGSLYPGPQMIRLETDAGVPAPVVHARFVNRLSAVQFAELPVVRESTLQALDPAVLTFPGASRIDGTYSNLILESIGDASTTTEVLAEVFDSQGQLLGSGHFTVTGESTLQATTIVDVVGMLKVSVLDGGQVRITKLSGDGVLWGLLSTIGGGLVTVNFGANP